MTARIPRHQLSQGGFTRAGRTIKNHAGQPVGFEHAAQQFARPQKMFLTGEFLQGGRAHTHRQRRNARQIFLAML